MNMWVYRTPGIFDELFAQSDKVPGPTKEEIRVLTISKARLREGHYVIDVGCGTGSLTIEAALQVAQNGKVFAIDEDEESIKLTKENITKFGVQNIVQVIHGKAPEVMINLPKVDVTIIGGSLSLREVIRASYDKLKENGRIVVNTVLLETGYTALNEIRKLNFKDIDVVQVFIAKGKEVGTGMMMLARNPVTIISATKA
ncbi:MAG: precorrin-6Y C5,15-methyltransferase (decarboxylating) subunit CbiT [Nitrososphaerales archaeon]